MGMNMNRAARMSMKRRRSYSEDIEDDGEDSIAIGVEEEKLCQN